MNAADQQIALSGLLIDAALRLTLGGENKDEVTVNAPARDEKGELLDPTWLRFKCQLKTGGDTFDFEVWPIFVLGDTALHLNWRAQEDVSVRALATGYIDDGCRFRVEQWGDRDRFIEALKRQIAEHKNHILG